MAGLVAGASFDCSVSFAISANETDAILSRIKSVTDLIVDGYVLKIHGGRLKASVQLSTDEPPIVPAIPEKLATVPAGFIESLKVASKFIGDVRWSAGVRLYQNRITAASKAVAIDITLEGLDSPIPVMLTKAAVLFLISQPAPLQYAVNANTVFFKWANDRWLSAQLLNDMMPEAIVKGVFDKVAGDCPIPITDETRAACADAIALSEGKLWITKGGFEGRKGVAKTFCECPMDLPEDHCSAWGAADIEAMMTCATAWNLAQWPEPVGFIGPNIRGAISGIRA